MGMLHLVIPSSNLLLTGDNLSEWYRKKRRYKEAKNIDTDGFSTTFKVILHINSISEKQNKKTITGVCERTKTMQFRKLTKGGCIIIFSIALREIDAASVTNPAPFT